jgi:hypothetical protein
MGNITSILMVDSVIAKKLIIFTNEAISLLETEITSHKRSVENNS